MIDNSSSNATDRRYIRSSAAVVDSPVL